MLTHDSSADGVAVDIESGIALAQPPQSSSSSPQQPAASGDVVKPKVVGGALPMEVDFEGSFTTFRKKQVPIRLVWKDLEYSVYGSGPKRKILLNKISGEANPGEVVALMGVGLLLLFLHWTHSN